MKRFLFVACLLLFAAQVEAQPAPTIVSTLQTTNTSATSLQVGCAIGSATCTGGIVAGPIIGSALGAESGYVEIQSNVPVSTTNRLYNSSGTLFWNGSAVAIGGSISGTTNDIPVFTSSNSIGNSVMVQSGGNTITVSTILNATTLGGTLSTVSQPNVTTMAALASIGTITTGVWQGTAVGVQWGGTGSNLSGTGGTSQFLRQNSVGAAVTVVRPAVADLSDNSNIFLLNANNTVTGIGGQLITGSTNGSLAAWNATNTSNGTSASTLYTLTNDASITGFIQLASSGYNVVSGWASSLSVRNSNGAGGLNLTSESASGSINFYVNGLNKRWGVNSAGDFTFGASSHLADSSGTPTIASGGGVGPAIAGTDYAFVVTAGTGSPVSVQVSFGHTWSNTPVCIGSTDQSTAVGVIIGPVSTTSVTANDQTGGLTSGNHWFVQCRGY